MPIRYLAIELYRWQRRVTELEKALEALGPQASPDRASVEAELHVARQEQERYRGMLDAKKEPPPWRTGFSH